MRFAGQLEERGEPPGEQPAGVAMEDVTTKPPPPGGMAVTSEGRVEKAAKPTPVAGDKLWRPDKNPSGKSAGFASTPGAPSSSPVQHAATARSTPSAAVEPGVALAAEGPVGAKPQRGVLQDLERELKALAAKDAPLTLEVRSARTEVQKYEALLETAKARLTSAGTERDTVRKRQQDLRVIHEEFRDVARRAAELLHKKL